MFGLNGAHTLQHLERLSICGDFEIGKEDILWVLRGRRILREISVDVEHFFDTDVVAALPDSTESLAMTCQGTLPGGDREMENQCSNAIAGLPNLRQFEAAYQKGLGWPRLLPVAARLETLKIGSPNCDDATFVQLVSSAINLKTLSLDFAVGNYENLLIAVSCLPKLQNFDLAEGRKYMRECDSLHLNSEGGLLALAVGPVRRSLESCRISLTGRDEQLDDSLLRCFNEHVEPSFEKKSSRFIRHLGFYTLR